MSLDGAYDPDNIFAKIVRGEASAVKVYEDPQVLAFMDVFPQSRGHTLVVSKVSRARNLLEMEPEVLAGLIQTVQKLTKAVREAFDPDGVMVAQFNGAAAGQTVFHLHFHIIPRWAGVEMGRHGQGMADLTELEALAEAIKARL
jgi:histidine triad (HIT) family protein